MRRVSFRNVIYLRKNNKKIKKEMKNDVEVYICIFLIGVVGTLWYSENIIDIFID